MHIGIGILQCNILNCYPQISHIQGQADRLAAKIQEIFQKYDLNFIEQTPQKFVLNAGKQ